MWYFVGFAKYCRNNVTTKEKRGELPLNLRNNLLLFLLCNALFLIFPKFYRPISPAVFVWLLWPEWDSQGNVRINEDYGLQMDSCFETHLLWTWNLVTTLTHTHGHGHTPYRWEINIYEPTMPPRSRDYRRPITVRSGCSPPRLYSTHVNHRTFYDLRYENENE